MTESPSASIHLHPDGAQSKLNRTLPEIQERGEARRNRTMSDRCKRKPRVRARDVKSAEWLGVAS
jgi:hypothetical protein